MMQKILGSLAMLLLLVGTSPAQADDEMNADVLAGPLYTCQMSGHIHGLSIAIGIGAEHLSGKGQITCVNRLNGRSSTQNVKFSLLGGGIGLDLTKIKDVRIYTAKVGVMDPRTFIGSFSVGETAGASLGRVGVEFDAAIEVRNRAGADFEVGFQGRDILGLGAHLYTMGFKISRR